MTEHTHQLRALLLAAIMALSVVAGGVAFAGNSVADEHHGLTATDGAGGNASSLIAGFDDQLPNGVESGDSTLRVEATNQSFPSEFSGELRVNDSDLAIADDSPDDIDLVVIDEFGNEKYADQNAGIEITHVGPDHIAFNVTDDSVLSGDIVAVEIRRTWFDASQADTGTSTLQWTVNGERTTYDMQVEPFDPDLTATDDESGFRADVTAGAENQSLFSAAMGSTSTTSDRTRNLVLRGDEGDFPSKFEVNVSLAGEDVAFHDLNARDLSVTSSSGNAYIVDITSEQITVEVTQMTGDSEDVALLEIEGATVDVPPGAERSNVTWDINGETDAYELVPARPDAYFAADYAVPRGLDGTPADGATVEITGTNQYTEGLHDSDENISVRIPADRRDNLSFDTTADTTADVEVVGSASSSPDADVTVTESELIVSVTEDIDHRETVVLSNVRFNTSGFDGSVDADAADFRSDLEVVTIPVNNGSFAPVEVTTDNSLDVGTPAITVDGNATQLKSGTASANGTSDLGVSIEDTTGHQIAPGSDIVVSLDGDDGIALDTDQSVTVSGALSNSTTTNVTANAIVVSVDENASPTAAGDNLTIEAADGDGLRFDTTDATEGDAVAFSVETNAGDAPVVQTTDTVASVSDPGLTVDRDTLALADGQTVTAEVLDANDQPVADANVSIASDALNVSRTATTGSDGTATFTLNLTDADTVDTIAVNTTVDGRELTETVETAAISANVSRLPAGQETAVGVTVNASAEGAAQNVTVTATATEFDIQNGTATTGDDGVATFTVTPDAGGDIAINATVSDATLETGVTSVAPTMSVTPDNISAGEQATVEVTIEALDGPDGEVAPRSGVVVDAQSDQYGINRTAETNDSGVATFTFELPEDADDGTIALSATVDDIALTDDVSVSGGTSDDTTGDDNTTDNTTDDTNSGDDTTDDTSSGDDTNSGDDTTNDDTGSPPPSSSPSSGDDEPQSNITVTNATLSATQIETGDSLEVTASVENVGEASGERDINVFVNGVTVANETVALDAGDSGTISATLSFQTTGEREIAVGDVTAGTVTIEDGADETSDNETSDDGSSDEGTDETEPEPPAGAVAFDAREIDDTTPEESGVNVEFENVSVESITFVEGANGEVSVVEMDELPDGVPETPGSLLKVMEISVPDNLSDEQATLRFTLNESELEAVDADPESIRLGHYTDGGWDIHQPELVATEDGELVYEAEVPGFSLYSVYAQDSVENSAEEETAAATETGSDPVDEEAGLVDSPVTAVLGFVGIIALVLSIAGARMYQQNDSL